MVVSTPKAVYTTGNEIVYDTVPADGQWKTLSTVARGILTITIFPTVPAAPDTVIADSYIIKVFASPTLKNPPSDPGAATDNLILVWKDKVGVFRIPMRLPGNRAYLHVCIKNTYTLPTTPPTPVPLVVTVTVEN